MTLASDPFKADFSGMTGKPGSEGAIAISQVVHKAVLDVTEESTEAAAATTVEMVARSAVQPEPFRADRPFLFFITDTTTGAVLFEGRIVDPR
jgi:serpin B